MEEKFKERNVKKEWDILEFAFTIVVDVLVTVSFCTSVMDSSIKSVVVLFGLTYFASFFEQRKQYKVQGDKKREKQLSDLGCILSVSLLTMCVMVGIGFLNLDVRDNKVIILGSAPNSILPFETINITFITYTYMHYPIGIHFLIGMVERWKGKGINVEYIILYIKGQWRKTLVCTAAGGIIGWFLCDINALIRMHRPKKWDYLGEPQYLKYAVAGVILAFLIVISGQVYKCVKFQEECNEADDGESEIAE